MMHNIFSTSGQGAADDGPSAMETLTRDRRRATSPLFYECVWLDGELVPAEDAALRDQPGIFEEIRCYPTERGPAIFRLEAHLQRFLQTARSLGMGELRYNLLELRRAVHVTIHVNNLSACTVRPILYVDRQPRQQQDRDQYPAVAVVTNSRSTSGDAHSHPGGARLMVTALDREERDRGTTREALQSRATRITKARATARRAGFEEAILTDHAGYVLDCTGDNLFLVRNGAVYTPPQAENRHDVARHTALTLLHDMGYPVTEGRISHDYLRRADEIFLCGTAGGVVSVRQIDSRLLNDEQPGPVTRRVQELYAETTRGQGRRSRGWLEYVMMEPLF